MQVPADNEQRWRRLSLKPSHQPLQLGKVTLLSTIQLRTSDQARGPAEFKHITKRRKRN
jgi:hypothetical protein